MSATRCLPPSTYFRLTTLSLDQGFRNEDIFMLTDDAKDPRAVPTKLNMLDAMHWLVTGAKTHDSLFFHCKCPRTYARLVRPLTKPLPTLC